MRIRVGVVGVGRWGRLHARKYSSIPEVELVAVVDINRERAEEVASEVGSRPYYHHHEILGKVDAVSIATPTYTHYTIAKDFLEEGVDVLLEKPMATTPHEAKELEELASRKGLILQIGHLERFNGAVEALDGFLSFPLSVESWRMAPCDGRGTDVSVVLDLMIHDIDLLLHLVPLEIERVEAQGTAVFTPLPDVAQANLRFSGGCVANLFASRVAPEKVRKMLIHQPGAHLVVDFVKQRLWVARKGGGVRLEEKGGQRDSRYAEIETFLRCVRRRIPPLVSAADGRRALEIATEILRVMERECEVDDGS